MAYPTDKPSGNYKLRDSNFAELDSNKIPMDNGLWKTGYKNAEESEVESVPDAHEQNWLFDVLHRNLKYTQETAEENKRLLETKVASPTNICQVKIGYGLNITAGGVLSVAKDVAADANIISYDLPVGSYMLWCGKNTPEYFLEPDGSPLLRSSYPELWEFAERNNLVGTLFGSGNGSTTFTITDIRGSFISIADSNEKVGKFTEAGLPNITGNLNMGNNYDLGSGTGAFRVSDDGNYSGAANGKGYRKSSFDASRSNPIYGKSNTVTPANWGLKLIIKAKPTPPSNAVPTGTILDYTGDSERIPDGYVVANGGELSRTEFSRLYQWALANNLIKDKSEIPTTPHAYYGTGDGLETFSIPDLRGVSKCSADLGTGRNNLSVGSYSPSHSDRCLVSKYVSGANWCNIYSDGWCEQGGYKTGSFNHNTKHMLHQPYPNNNYTVVANCNISTGLSQKHADCFHVVGQSGKYAGDAYTSMTWLASGYINKPSVTNYTSLSGNVATLPILKY
jgi:microcystin-dependent protein